MAQEFLATAFVQIKPQVRGFKTALQRDLKTALAGFTLPVKVTPQLGSLRAALTNEIRKTPIPVAISPDLIQFKRELAAATADLKIEIPVETKTPAGGVGQGGGGGGGEAGGGAAKRELTVLERQIELRKQLANATTLATQAQISSLPPQERLTLLRRAETVTQRALTQAIELGTVSQSKSTQQLRERVSEAFKSNAAIRDELGARKKVIESTKEEAAADQALARAKERQRRAQAPVLNALSELEAARRRVTRATALFNAAEKAVDAALLTGDPIRKDAARDMFLLAEAEVAAAQAALTNEKAQAKQARTIGAVEKAAVASGAGMLGLRGAVLTAGTTFLGATVAFQTFAKSVRLAAELETELNVFAVTAGATADQMERVSEVARELGADITLPGVSAGDAAKTLTDLAKAGLDVQDAVAGARGTLQLATAAEIEFGEASQLVASALNSFGLAGSNATRVADLLTGSALESQGTIADMGVALQQAAAAARQAGISLDDTVALLTLLARNGLRGSDAGTSLRTAFLRLIKPTKDAQANLTALSVAVRDIEGNIRPEVFADLGKALSELSAAQRDRTLAEIFGQDAFRAAAILGREGVVGLDAMRSATGELGLAAEVAGARTKGFAGQVEALKNSLQTLGGSFGRAVIPPLGETVELLNDLISAANRAEDAFRDLEDALPGKREGEESSSFFDGFKRNLPEIINDFREFASLATSGRFVEFGQTPAQTIEENNERIKELITNLEFLQSLGGPAQAAEVFEVLSLKLIGTGEAATEARQQMDDFSRLFTALGRAPTDIELRFFINKGFVLDDFNEMRRLLGEQPVEIPVSLLKGSIFEVKREAKDAGEEIADSIAEGFSSVMTPELGAALMIPFLQGAQSAAGAAQPTPARGLTAKQILGRVAGFEAEQVRAELRGGTTELLQVLIEEQAFLQQALQSRAARNQIGLRRQLESALLGVQNEISSINERAKTQADQAAKDAQSIRDKRDRAAVEGFGRRREDIENRLLIAESTETLRDDLKVNKNLRNTLIKQNKLAQERIKDLETRRDFVRDNAKRIIQINLEIKQLEEDLAEQQREIAEERRDQIRESIRLDIEFGEITENERFEEQARRRLIASLNKELAVLQAIKKKSQEQKNRIKEIRNEIAREKAAIKELRDEAEDRNEEFRRLLFEQLQAQQGFTANLLSNLFPSGAASSAIAGNIPRGGPVFTTAGGRTPGSAIGTAAGIAAARERGGFTTSQATTLVELTRRLLDEIRALRLGESHPSARHQRSVNRASMDTMPM